jgi:hypothetical protein
MRYQILTFNSPRYPYKLIVICVSHQSGMLCGRLVIRLKDVDLASAFWRCSRPKHLMTPTLTEDDSKLTFWEEHRVSNISITLSCLPCPYRHVHTFPATIPPYHLLSLLADLPFIATRHKHCAATPWALSTMLSLPYF